MHFFIILLTYIILKDIISKERIDLMDTVISENKVSEVASFNGIKIYTIKSKKFKTNSINIFFYDEIGRAHV